MSQAENTTKRGRGHNYTTSRTLRSDVSYVQKRGHRNYHNTSQNQQHRKKKDANPFIGDPSTDLVMKEIKQRKLQEANQVHSENEVISHIKYPHDTQTNYRQVHKATQKHPTNPYIDTSLMKTVNTFSPQHNKQFMDDHKTYQKSQPHTVSLSKAHTEFIASNRSNCDYKSPDHQIDQKKPDNYGWPEGWSLEQEFMKQSATIILQPEHQKYLKKREIHDKYPREVYRRRKREPKKHILHWGQRKLLLSEIEFLNANLSNTKRGNDGLRLVVYAGAASGKHIPLLIEMYPDILLHLWDPNDFCAAVKRVERVEIYQKYFTDKVAEMYGRLGRDILFISDIRTADYKRQIGKECEGAIIKDNELQSKWTKCMTCNACLVAAMIKFRMPYPDVVAQQEWNQICLDGTIKLGIWAPVTSTETRLHIKPDKNGCVHDKMYNAKVYEQQLFWFNVKGRQSFIDNSRYYCSKYGVIHSYDCWAECLILEQYLTYYKGVKQVTKTDVIKLVNKITKFINDKRCLLSMPPDPEQQKHGLGISNHSHFHHNQRAANPAQHRRNQHGLIGYEGILYIDPEQTQKEHDRILEAMEQNSINTWKLLEVNQMMNILPVSEHSVNSKMNGTICVLPCYNRPIYNMIFVDDNIYVIPLKGFGHISFKISPEYYTFYRKCFGDLSCCCLTGFLLDNHGMKTSEKDIRFEFSIIDILTANSPKDYKQRTKQIENVISNYGKYKHMVIESDIYKFMPFKLSAIPSQSDMISFKQNVKICGAGEMQSSTKINQLQCKDIYFDTNKYKEPPFGLYWNNIALNSRICGALIINNNDVNALFSTINFCNL